MSSTSQLSYEVLGAVKIKDGVFVGDGIAAHDGDFVIANKVSHVINCCGQQVTNHWEDIGVVYLTYSWVDNDSQVILDPNDVVANEVFHFVDECLSHAESVLIHSARGQSRSCCVLAAYMMRKYSWNLRKTMEFLMARRPDMNLKPSFLQQLAAYERRLQSASKTRFSSDWNDIPANSQSSPLESEELLLRNTYLNSQIGQPEFVPPAEVSSTAHHTRLMWADSGMNDKSKLETGTHVPTKRPGDNSMMKSILRKRKAKSDNPYFHSRSTTASSEAELQSEGKTCDAPDAVSYERRENPVSAWEANDRTASVRSALPRDEDSSNRNGREASDSHRDERAAHDRAPDRESREITEARDAWERHNAQDGKDGKDGEDGRGRDVREFRDGRERDVRQSQELREHVRDSREFRGRDRDVRQSQEREGRLEERANSLQRTQSPSTTVVMNGRSSELTPGGRFLPGSKLKPDRYDSSIGTRRRDASPKSDRDRLGLRSDSLRLQAQGTKSAIGLGSLPSRSSPALTGQSSSMSLRSGVNGGVMGAFRGGPVKAKVELFSACVKGRPSTAPTTRPFGRPASPLGICRQSSSRSASPGAPITRSQKSIAPAYPSLDKQQRTLSSHMRRAPSPTPAFNRTASPGKPRWRM